eukprot:SAG31_NODE_2139_length_6349_cov_2.773636_10_plen_153_part_00
MRTDGGFSVSLLFFHLNGCEKYRKMNIYTYRGGPLCLRLHLAQMRRVGRVVRKHRIDVIRPQPARRHRAGAAEQQSDAATSQRTARQPSAPRGRAPRGVAGGRRPTTTSQRCADSRGIISSIRAIKDCACVLGEIGPTQFLKIGGSKFKFSA